MPSLILLDHFKGDNPRYFPPYYLKGCTTNLHGHRDWKKDVKESYPYEAFVHCDELDGHFYQSDFGFWVDMRRWVERCAAGDIIIDYENMGYKWWWNKDATNYEWSKKTTDIKHGYWHFYFETDSDLKMFVLKFGKMVKMETQEYHPDFGKDIFDQDRIKGRSAETI